MKRPWCRACGQEVPPGSPACPACSITLAGPAPGPVRVGRVIVLPGLLHRHGLVVAESGDSVSVLDKGPNVRSMPTADLDRLTPITVPGPTVLGAAGRLWAADQARTERDSRARWSGDEARRFARAAADAEVAATRAAALDALALGLPGEADRLSLTRSELAWYRARHAARTGDLAGLLSQLEQLPAEGYRPRLLLLLHSVGKLAAHPALAARARDVVRPLRAEPLGETLWLGLAERPTGAEVAVALAYSETLSTLLGQDLTGPARAVAARERLPLLPPGHRPALRAYDAALAGLEGYLLDDVPSSLGALPVELLERLVDVGAVRQVPGPSTRGLADEGAAFLRCRLSPGTATDTDLQRFGMVAEQARRLYLAGSGDELARLPQTDAVDHYRALHAYRTDGHLDLERLRPGVHEILCCTEKLRSDGGEVPPEVAADPTLWQRLARAAVAQKLTYDTPGDLSAWLELVTMQNAIFEARWDEVLQRCDRVRATATAERLIDEALNLSAYAQWHLGRRDEAVALLDDAAQGQSAPALLMNAALIAAEIGCEPAIGYLGRFIQVEPDPETRTSAVLRAVTLWLGSEPRPDYPAPLRALIANALAAPMEDELFRTLVQFTAREDPGWLNRAQIEACGRAQHEYLDYERLRARVRLDDHSEELSDVIRALAPFCRRDPVPEWAAKELSAMVDSLLELVHVPFGEAAGTVGLIEELIATGITPLPARIVLAVQAGAHVATYLDERDSSLTPEAEQKLLFDPVEIFRVRAGELDEGQRTSVADELVRCLIMAGIALQNEMVRQGSQFIDTWNQGAARQRTVPHEQGVEIGRRLDQLKEQTYEWPRRLARYVSVLQTFALSDNQKNVLALLSAAVRDFISDLDRAR